jgi:putative ABC transport system substrate-binding protein
LRIRAALTTALLLSLVMLPLAAEAQSPSGPGRIGFMPLGSPSNPYDQSLVEAFRRGLRESGLVENRQVILDVAWIGAESEIAGTVKTLIERGARILVPVGTSASVETQRQTSTIPILFISVGNPLGVGLVGSLSRPGGNVTGFSDLLAELSGKYVQFARELGKPQAPVHYLWHTGWADGQYRFQATERAAQAVGVTVRPRGIADVAELGDAFAAMKKAGAATVIIQPSPFTYRQRVRIIESATNHGLAAIFAFPPEARDGALIAYGPDYADLYRRAGAAVDRFLKGAKPADFPVEQPSKFEMIINLKTAKALGLTVPPSLLQQATEIIQ